MENPIETDDLGGPPLFLETPNPAILIQNFGMQTAGTLEDPLAHGPANRGLRSLISPCYPIVGRKWDGIVDLDMKRSLNQQTTSTVICWRLSLSHL